MSDNLLTSLEALRDTMGLSDHRIGILAANNGRLLERLRSGGRVWPETEAKIRSFIQAKEKDAA